jgi:hypothetical protein
LYFSYTENKTIDGQVILDMDGNGDLNNWMVERKVMKVVERETKRVIVEIEKREEKKNLLNLSIIRLTIEEKI